MLDLTDNNTLNIVVHCLISRIPCPLIGADENMGAVITGSIHMLKANGVDRNQFRSIMSALRPALNVLRQPLIELNQPGVVEALSQYLNNGIQNLENIVAPNIPLTEALIFTLLQYEFVKGDSLDGVIPLVIPLLAIAIEKEGYSSNSLIYATQRDEEYYFYDQPSSLAECLYVQKPMYGVMGLNQLLLSLYDREPFRRHPNPLNDVLNLENNIFDAVPYCLFSGNYSLAMELIKRGAYASNADFRTQLVCVSLHLLVRSLKQNGYSGRNKEHLAALAFMVGHKLIGFNDLVVKPNTSQKQCKSLNPDKQPLSAYLMDNLPEMYDFFSRELLNYQAERSLSDNTGQNIKAKNKRL